MPDTPNGTIQWSPESDLRNCGVGIVVQAIRVFEAGFDEAGRPLPWLAARLEAAGGTAADLQAACAAFSRALEETLRDPDSVMAEALARHGFEALPRGIQDLFASSLGRAALGTIIYCCRDGARIGQTPDYHFELQQLLEAGRRMAEGPFLVSRPSRWRRWLVAMGLVKVRP